MIAPVKENCQGILKIQKLTTGALEAGFILLSDLVSVHKIQVKTHIETQKYPMILTCL